MPSALLSQLENQKNMVALEEEISSDKVASFSPEELISAFCSDQSAGLDSEQAALRLKKFGPNAICKQPPATGLKLFFNQFKSTVVAILIIASMVSIISGEHIQAFAILAAVLINACVGFLTEYKAKVSLEALEALTGPLARVRRGGRESEIAATDLVPGDLLILEAGCRIPADLRLLTGTITVDASALTGESVPVSKSPLAIENEPEIAMAYQGSLVLQGHAKTLVVATGSRTRLGKLGVQLCEVAVSATPMEKSLEHLGRQLSVLTVVICILVFLVGICHKENTWQMLQASVALAVAAIPEGLPVVATLALAIGTQRMVRFGALIRKLSAVETLGCTRIICTDKTGTLTQNRMTVSDIVCDNRNLKVSGTGYSPIGEITESGIRIDVGSDVVLESLLKASSLCNDAKLENHSEEAEWHVHGDPTEGALITVAKKGGVEQEEQKRSHPRVLELPFDVARKRMTTIHQSSKGLVAFVKGSPESILDISTMYLTSHGVAPLNDERRAWFLLQNELMARRGLRVLAVGSRELGTTLSTERDEVESHVVLLGLSGMADQPKIGVKEAIAHCQNAGIQIVMLTGDQPATAKAIAQELNIILVDDQVQIPIGDELEKMSDEALSALLHTTPVIARVKPETKYSIVRHLQTGGAIVAMTGDGVNDASALRQADIGVAMGQGGTALAREASDMILTDDNFTTIVRAIEEGRGIYKNIACAIAYLLTASLASVIVVVAPVLCDQGLPLSPLQLLWLNLIMHVFPALGLVMQRSPAGIMNERPRDPSQQLLGTKIMLQIVARAFLVAGASWLAAVLCKGDAVPEDRTVILATVSTALLLQSWSWFLVNHHRGSQNFGIRINRPMVVNTVLGLALLLAAIYLPPLSGVLQTTHLSLNDWFIVSMVSVLSFVLSLLLARRASPGPINE